MRDTDLAGGPPVLRVVQWATGAAAPGIRTTVDLPQIIPTFA